MWRTENGCKARNYVKYGTWLSLCGLIGSIFALVATHGWERYLSASTLAGFFLVLLSVFVSTHSVWHRDTPKLDLIEEQRRNPSEFVYTRLAKFYPRASNDVAMDVEWTNGSVLTLEIQSASGSVTMNSMELGQIAAYVGKQRCDPGRRCTCTLYLKPDAQHIGTLSQLQSERKAADWSMNVEWIVKVVDTDTSVSVQGPSGTKRIVPGGDL